MKKKFNKQLFGHFIAVFSGKIGASGLGFIVSLAIARLLGPENFGLFSFFLIWAQIGSCFVGDIFANALIRNYSYSLKNNKSHTGSILLNALFIRLFFGIIFALAGILLSEEIALYIFENPEYNIPIKYGSIASLTISLWTFSLTVLQASESFIKHGLLSPVVNLIRLTAIPVLFKFSLFSVNYLIMVFVGSYFFCGISAILFLSNRFKGARFEHAEIIKQLSFSRWMTVSVICLVLINFLAIPVLGYYSGNHEVGIYAAGANLLIVFEHITNALVTIQYPKMAKLTQPDELRRFVLKSFKFSLLIVFLLTPVFYLIDPFILLVYGPEYHDSGLIFKILFIAMLATMITQPLSLMFLVLNKSHYWGNISMISLLFWLIASYYLIPHAAAVGAAIATLIARFSYSFITSIMLFITFHPRKEIKIP